MSAYEGALEARPTKLGRTKKIIPYLAPDRGRLQQTAFVPALGLDVLVSRSNLLHRRNCNFAASILPCCRVEMALATAPKYHLLLHPNRNLRLPRNVIPSYSSIDFVASSKADVSTNRWTLVVINTSTIDSSTIQDDQQAQTRRAVIDNT